MKLTKRTTANMIRHLLTCFAMFLLTPVFSQKQIMVGQRITGDFNGDGRVDTAFVKQTGNPKTKTRSWSVSFSDKTMASMHLGCCAVYLIYEGDLNNDKATEISVFQAPENGCTYRWTTYSYKNGKWTTLIPLFLVPTACDPIKVPDLENKVFIENGLVYYWDLDPNDTGNKQIKKQVTIK